MLFSLGQLDQPQFGYNLNNRQENSKTHVRLTSQAFNEWQWEVILPCCLIELSVVYAHSPSSDCSCRDQFILLIRNNSDSSFLWNYLNMAHPWTVQDWIDDSRILELHDFFVNYFFYCGIQSPLRLHNSIKEHISMWEEEV
ncbi:hypothetical protein PIB30_083225 [Stylosanthes scabra]|uniref:Uncharacterized protein n=1 Tax=Stylosanthes scabra TaxID=79078 RepID=A0ABU6XQP9_9FABA|nr:hypothetical protein [Stylosanthes scabra]